MTLVGLAFVFNSSHHNETHFKFELVKLTLKFRFTCYFLEIRKIRFGFYFLTPQFELIFIVGAKCVCNFQNQFRTK